MSIDDSISFGCPKCHRRLKAQSSAAGKRIRCPNPDCSTAFTVPSGPVERAIQCLDREDPDVPTPAAQNGILLTCLAVVPALFVWLAVATVGIGLVGLIVGAVVGLGVLLANAIGFFFIIFGIAGGIMALYGASVTFYKAGSIGARVVAHVARKVHNDRCDLVELTSQAAGTLGLIVATAVLLAFLAAQALPTSLLVVVVCFLLIVGCVASYNGCAAVMDAIAGTTAHDRVPIGSAALPQQRTTGAPNVNVSRTTVRQSGLVVGAPMLLAAAGFCVFWPNNSRSHLRGWDAAQDELVVSPRGAIVAGRINGGWGHKSGHIRLWDLESGKALRTTAVMTAPHRWIFSPDGRQLAVTGYDIPLSTWNVDSGERLQQFDCDRWHILIGFVPDGRELITATMERGGITVHFWDTETGRKISTAEVPEPGNWDYTSLSLSPDGHELMTQQYGRAVTLWDVKSGGKLVTLKGGPQNAIFSPDGARIYAGTETGEVQIWDARSGELIQSFGEKVGPDEKTLGYVPSFRLWLSMTGTELFALRDGELVAWDVKDKSVLLRRSVRDDFGAAFRGKEGFLKMATITLDPQGRRALVKINQDLRLWKLRD